MDECLTIKDLQECITDQFVKYLNETINIYPTAFFNADRMRF